MFRYLKEKGISRNVLLTGFTSFFTDISSEMVYPLLQAFVSLILAARKALLGPVLGLIEGVAESTASLIRVFAGYYSDRIEKRKAPVIAGYSSSALAKVLLLLASTGWYFVLLSRFLDRVGKGIRTAPRDALISESVGPEVQGRAFGLQRAMDFAGATLGSVAAFFLVRRFLDPRTGNLMNLSAFSTVFLASLIPAALGVFFLFFLRENRRKRAAAAGRLSPSLDFRRYPRNLQIFFLAQFIFTLGNSSNQFLLLRSMDLGFALTAVILMYLVFNLFSSLLSTLFGSLSDRIGRKKVLMLGYGLYALVYLAFGFISRGTGWLLWVFWPVYGIYYAMTEGVEKAFVSDIAPEGSRATVLGFYHTIVGIGLLPASILAGVLFSLLPSAPFIFGGGTAAVTLLVLGVMVRLKPPTVQAASKLQ
ncbi:MAG TPA: MFS transporter [Spirochaetia bacterium]|nr:MFS transporter [Spirochaetia bacterium]